MPSTETIFICEFCKKKFNRKSYLKRHEARVHHKQSGPLSDCEVCGYQPDNAQQLYEHRKRLHGKVKIYHCDSCEYQAKERRTLRKHRMTVHEGIRFSCDLCDHQATRNSSLKIHKDTVHFGVKRYKCNVCAKEFTWSNDMKRHIKVNHARVIETFNCDQCDYTCKRQDILKSHKDSKHLQIKYTCEHCGQNLMNKRNLKIHVESIHQGIKYDCELCEYSGTQKSSLWTHKRQQHDGIYPKQEKFKCDVCGKYCGDAGKLKSHAKSHIQKICDLCGQTFRKIGAHVAGGRMCQKNAKLSK